MYSFKDRSYHIEKTAKYDVVVLESKDFLEARVVICVFWMLEDFSSVGGQFSRQLGKITLNLVNESIKSLKLPHSLCIAKNDTNLIFSPIFSLVVSALQMNLDACIM